MSRFCYILEHENGVYPHRLCSQSKIPIEKGELCIGVQYTDNVVATEWFLFSNWKSNEKHVNCFANCKKLIIIGKINIEQLGLKVLPTDCETVCEQVENLDVDKVTEEILIGKEKIIALKTKLREEKETFEKVKAKVTKEKEKFKMVKAEFTKENRKFLEEKQKFNREKYSYSEKYLQAKKECEEFIKLTTTPRNGTISHNTRENNSNLTSNGEIVDDKTMIPFNEMLKENCESKRKYEDVGCSPSKKKKTENNEPETERNM